LAKKRQKFKSKLSMTRIGNQMRTSLLNFTTLQPAKSLMVKILAVESPSWTMIGQEC
jgi:hypothetical protein